VNTLRDASGYLTDTLYPMDRSRKRKIFVLVALTIMAGTIAITLLLLSKPLRISFHERAMRTAWDEATRAKDGHSGSFETSFEAFQRHRDMLVYLGHYRKYRFPLNHINDLRSRQAQELWRALLKRASDMPIVELESSERTTPRAIVVWTVPEDAAEWESLVASFDNPDSSSQ
jgi:hypothetical protein